MKWPIIPNTICVLEDCGEEEWSAWST